MTSTQTVATRSSEKHAFRDTHGCGTNKHVPRLLATESPLESIPDQTVVVTVAEREYFTRIKMILNPDKQLAEAPFLSHHIAGSDAYPVRFSGDFLHVRPSMEGYSGSTHKDPVLGLSRLTESVIYQSGPYHDHGHGSALPSPHKPCPNG
ncbi:uncharacterized protein LOC144871285 [Branchiostoma floridae x Branchiostoma japonicum]